MAPLACEHNLTEPAMNRLAWIGHAACCMAIGCPEETTRQAWGLLNDEQRVLANQEAEKALNEWLNEYQASHIAMEQEMGIQRLF